MSVLEKIPAKVGMMSLIGVGSERPCSWGNYFSFSGTREVRCLNMWAENLETARERFLGDGRVEVRIWEENDRRFAIVVDERIPSDWLYQKLCFTGYYRPSLAIATEIFEHIGDPNNELEQWTDPVSYYAKRGGRYNPESGIITYHVAASSRKLNNTWTIEPAEELKATYGADLETELENRADHFFAPYIPIIMGGGEE